MSDATGSIFPYQDLLSAFRVDITPWIITGIVVYFALSSLYLFFRLRRLRVTLAELAGDPSPERLQEAPLLQHLWWKYEQSFLAKTGPRQKTELDAQDVFDEYGVIGQQVNLRYWTAVPGVLLALGIFGTFLGLTLGLKDFDTSGQAAIQSSIQMLLGGMGTAFLTSLWGMVCSIGFNILEKGLLNRAGQSLAGFCQILDMRYKLSTAELRQFDREDREQFLCELFVSKTGGQETSPAELFEEMRASSVRQAAALELFSKILDASIRISTETLELRGRIKATIEETRRAGITQDELDTFLEDVVRTVQAPSKDKDAFELPGGQEPPAFVTLPHGSPSSKE